MALGELLKAAMLKSLYRGWVEKGKLQWDVFVTLANASNVPVELQKTFVDSTRASGKIVETAFPRMFRNADEVTYATAYITAMASVKNYVAASALHSSTLAERNRAYEIAKGNLDYMQKWAALFDVSLEEVPNRLLVGKILDPSDVEKLYPSLSFMQNLDLIDAKFHDAGETLHQILEISQSTCGAVVFLEEAAKPPTSPVAWLKWQIKHMLGIVSSKSDLYKLRDRIEQELSSPQARARLLVMR